MLEAMLPKQGRLGILNKGFKFLESEHVACVLLEMVYSGCMDPKGHWWLTSIGG